jgi:hypothetical protein
MYKIRCKGENKIGYVQLEMGGGNRIIVIRINTV